MPSSTWNIDAVRSREAMSRVFDKNGPTNDWGGIVVAHLDTGFTNHVVFNLAGAAPALRVADGLNFMDAGITEPRDPLNYAGGLTQPGHGTRTLGALCGNLPGFYTGICPTVPVVPYRVTNSVMLSGQTIVNAALAIMDAVDRHLADVISISLGVQSVFGNVKQMHALGRAVDYAYERGVIVCCAAGQTRDAPQLVGFTVYPGRYSRSILVGGINAKREVCFDYDDGRKYVDVWAPADDVCRPNSIFGLPEPFTDVAGHGDGTSYATVHAAGAAAMWLRMRGEELDSGGYVGWKRVEAFRAMLRATKQPVAGNCVPSKKAPTDTGILDCVALVDRKLPRVDSLRKAALAEPQVN
jgi:subtilisin family serine protease